MNPLPTLPSPAGAARSSALATVLLAPLIGMCAPPDAPPPPHALMPRVNDYTLMGWADGFPSHTPSAPWLRVIRTGHYALALDTSTLRIPHFGAIKEPMGYAKAAHPAAEAWQRLPPASLELTLTVQGKTYRCRSGGAWSRFAGPRLIESGRFLQRADVTGLEFTAGDGSRLNVEARFETVAWPDRLALILAAQPGLQPIPPGEDCFGRIGGGFGLDGTNHLEFPHSPDLDPEQFTLELWAFVPADFQASDRTHPWLVCKNRHEQADGNYGIVLLDGRPQARLNIGGGRENQFATTTAEGLASPGGGVPRLAVERWHHLAMSYDGHTLRLFVNGQLSAEAPVGRPRVPGRDGLAFGRRQDNCGDGYHFRGVVDEIRLHHRALNPEEIRARFRNPEASNPALEPVRQWSFRAEGQASPTKLSERWDRAEMELRLASPGGELRQRWELPENQIWSAPDWQEVALAFDPVALQPAAPESAVAVQAAEIPGGAARPVEFDAARGWHRINLDGIEPIVPPGEGEKRNDALERVSLVLSNPARSEQTARLLFEKTSGGIRQRIGAPITGLSAILRHVDGQPTGIPVQLSKNWHNRPEGGVYSGQWFHGFSQVRLPPESKVELELTLAYGHWGGVAAASHAQLSLVGWGSNQLWDQSALGSWGESICYEPDRVQALCGILDVRPVMVRSMNRDQPWSWTHNVGGGDFFRLFDPAGNRVFPAGMRAVYERCGPCLTEVAYAGRLAEGIEHAASVSLARSDDLVRGIYRIRLDVRKPVEFSRFALLQIGADTYSYTGERKMALGNETGLLREWATQWGGNTYRTPPIECTGRLPWISLHEAARRKSEEAAGAWANRGLVIRSWEARLDGKPARPWIAERGVQARGEGSSTVDLVPPPGVARLQPGDFVEATIEHLVVPQFAADYYGPNQALRAALEQWPDSWRLIHREAIGNDRRVAMQTGHLLRTHPAVTVRAVEDTAAFTLTGGLAYVPITVTGLTSPLGHVLTMDSQPVNQAVHGNDFWQTDYDPATRSWSRTYSLPVHDGKPHAIRLE